MQKLVLAFFASLLIRNKIDRLRDEVSTGRAYGKNPNELTYIPLVFLEALGFPFQLRSVQFQLLIRILQLRHSGHRVEIYNHLYPGSSKILPNVDVS